MFAGRCGRVTVLLKVHKAAAGAALQQMRIVLAVRFHVLTQRARVRVRLLAAVHLAQVGLRVTMYMRVLFAVGRVGEFAITAFFVAFERLLSWWIKEEKD